MTSDWRWLPATPANLAKLVTQVPAGFRYVPPAKWGRGGVPDPLPQEPFFLPPSAATG
ncbi:MAG TPA: hypothetical protein VGI74_08075 [Streptosporangiaceae bacterium]